jgi:hypothetical protein
METIPLDQGKLTWVFPDIDDTDAVRASLAAADGNMRALADHLGLRAGWAGGGLEFHRVQGITLAGLFGFVEAPGVSFGARLYFPRRCLWDLRWGPPWRVEADIEVLCVQAANCAGHTAAETSRSCSSSAAAADALVASTAWLLGRGIGRPVASWHPPMDAYPDCARH